MAEITAEDIAALVQSNNDLAQVFQDKETVIDGKITDLVNAANSKLAGDFKINTIAVDAVNGDDLNPGTIASPVKTLDRAIEMRSPLFSYTEIRLYGGYTYSIANAHNHLGGGVIRIVGWATNTPAAIRGGAEDNRPKIILDIPDISPGSGPIDGSVRMGFYPTYGLSVTFENIVMEAPQGYEEDLDKGDYDYGPRLILWSGVKSSMIVGFVACRLNYGLGGFVALTGQGEMGLAINDCDLYFNPSASNLGCTKLARRGAHTTVRLSVSSVYGYDNQTSLQLTYSEVLSSLFSFLGYPSADSEAQPLGILSHQSLSRTVLGLV